MAASAAQGWKDAQWSLVLDPITGRREWLQLPAAGTITTGAPQQQPPPPPPKSPPPELAAALWLAPSSAVVTGHGTAEMPTQPVLLPGGLWLGPEPVLPPQHVATPQESLCYGLLCFRDLHQYYLDWFPVLSLE